MNDSEKIKVPLLRLELYVWALAVVWTIVVAASLVWNVSEEKNEVLKGAHLLARVAYEKDIIYRLWNAWHSGVYVPVTKETQPNPYLSDVPERDITTPSGKQLTLMNPAYMTRQVHELEKQKFAVRAHITSLNPIRPENAPDPWETEALQTFGRGETEISSVEKIEGKEYMRLMRPLITEKGCLKCHAKQGYHEGDIRGGISVSIPMEPLWAIGHRYILTLTLVHGLIWLAGLSGIGLGWQRLKRSEQERKQAEKELRSALEKRKELEAIIYRSPAIVFLWRAAEGWPVEFVSDNIEQFGYTPEDFISGRIPFAKIVHPEDLGRVGAEVLRYSQEGQTEFTQEYRIITKSGDVRWLDDRTLVRRDTNGIITHYQGVVIDISERKRVEEALRRIEWLLTKKPEKKDYKPNYGNLTELNRPRLILDLTGSEVLTDIVSGYLDLIDTSAAVYEKNGDYALGIFSSGWCRFLDEASRNLCDTEDNRQALESGKWACHESCWSESAKVAIETGQPVDIECFGGMHLYAVPVRAGEEIVGAINFGYGDPPKDPQKLQEIAQKCHVSVDKIREVAAAYDSRPAFIIDIAKERLLASARLLGEMLERKRTEVALHNALAESRQRQAEFSALLEGSHAVLKYREFKESARSIFDSCKNLIGATAGYVALLSQDATQTEVLFLDSGGRPCAVDPSLPMPVRGLREIAYRTGKTVYDNYFPQSEWTKYAPAGHVTLDNVLFAPLVIEGKAVGVLGLANKAGGFTEHDAEMATAFGNLAAVALYNSRILESLENSKAEIARRNDELAAHNVIATAISQSLDLDTILNTALDKVLAIVEVEAGGIFILDRNEKMMMLRVHCGLSEEFVQATQRIKVGEGITGRAVAERQPVMVDLPDYSTERLTAIVAREGLQSLISVPLVSKGIALGALNLGSMRRRAFSQKEIDFLVVVGQQIGVAVENAQLYEQVKTQRVEEQATLLRLSQEFLAILEPQETMRRAVATAAEALHADCADFMLLDEDEKALTLGFSQGREHLIGRLQIPNTDETFPGNIVRQKTPVIIEDTASDGRFQVPSFIHECGAVSALGVPVLAGEKTVGALIVDTQKRRLFSPEEAHFLSLIANQTAMAIEKARLFEEARRRLSRLTALGEVHRAITSLHKLDEILAILLENVIRFSHVDSATMMLLRPNSDELESIASLGVENKQLATLRLKVGEGAAGWVAKEGLPLAITDIQSDPRFHYKDLAAEARIISYIGIPLIVAGKTIGVLNLSTRQRHEFTAEEVDFLTTLGGEAAMAVENAQLYDQIEKRAKELNREVIRQKQYAETVLHSIADGVYTVDLNRVVLSWSKGGEAITGYTAEEAIGRSCADFLHHTDESGEVLCRTNRCPFLRVWASGQPVGTEQVSAHHKEGWLVPMAVTAAPIFDESGRSIGAVEVFRDVSKERELLKSIQEASRAKSEFLANMSHELRTPLNTIIGFSELMANEMAGPITDEQKEYLGDVIDSSRHLLSLINDILDLSKVEAGKMELELSECSVKEIIERTIVMFKEKAFKHRIKMEIGIEIENIMVDERKIKQVLFNLLSNAMKFTPDGGSVNVSARKVRSSEFGVRTNKDRETLKFQDSKELFMSSELITLDSELHRNFIEISVEDTGIGISEEDQKRLFQPFQQLDTTLTKKYPGTGLGLHLCKKFVELHGGRIWVESEVERGSRFSFTIPIRQ